MTPHRLPTYNLELCIVFFMHLSCRVDPSLYAFFQDDEEGEEEEGEGDD